MKRTAGIMLVAVCIIVWGCPAKKQGVKTSVVTEYGNVDSTDINAMKAAVKKTEVAVVAIPTKTPEIVQKLNEAIEQHIASVTTVTESTAAPIAEPTVNATTETVIDSEDSYSVRKGDCLWNISRTIYKTGFQWPLIYRENRDIISDPDEIEIGQELVIVKHPSQKQVADAVRYAQEYGEK